MVYSPPRPTHLQAAISRKAATVDAYRAALDAMSAEHSRAVHAYVAALAAEAAAQRVDARQAREALDRRRTR